MNRFFWSLLFKVTNNNYVLLFRYGIVAGVSLSIDIFILILLVEYAHLHYLLAASISFCLGAAVNFTLSIKWIFINPRVKSIQYEFLGVIAVALVGLALNTAIIWALTALVGIFYLYSKILSAVIVFFWNFFVRKQLMYKENIL